MPSMCKGFVALEPLTLSIYREGSIVDSQMPAVSNLQPSFQVDNQVDLIPIQQKNNG